MKSITKKISLLLVFSAILFLSSCLDSGKGSYAGNSEYSYITRDAISNAVYARTISGHYITSEKIKLLAPGSIVFVSYQINFDEVEQSIIVEDGRDVIVYHAIIPGEPVVANQSRISLMSAPDAPIMHFENIFNPIFASNKYFGDRWLFPYQVKMKKGEDIKIEFYKGTEDDSSSSSDDDLIIDVRFTKSGEAEAGATENVVEDYVVANFSDIRSMFEGRDKDKVNLKFRFYRKANGEDLFTLPDVYSMQLK